MGKWCLHASSFIFDQIVIKVAGNQDRHKSSDEFDFGPLVSMAHLYVFWNEIWPWHIGLGWAIVALWATCLLILLYWSIVHTLQTSQKPLGHSKPNFIWNLSGIGQQKFVQMIQVIWPRWPRCPYMVTTEFYELKVGTSSWLKVST